MLSFDRISHDPTECSHALSGATGPIYVDTETTGVHWNDRLVSIGILVDEVVFILFVRSNHRTVRQHQLTIDELRLAVRPLAIRDDLTAVFHNAPFDLVMLRKDEITLRCSIADTYKGLKLIDPDRGWEPEDSEVTGNSTGTVCRWDRRFEEQLSYKLKDVARHLLSLEAPGFPGRAASLDYDSHVEYLTSDLLITRQLHLHLLREFSEQVSSYYRDLVAPITPIVADMTFVGVQADREFISSETRQLTRLMGSISDAHRVRFGVQLDVSDHVMSQWIFHQLRCKPRWNHKRLKSSSGAYTWSLERSELVKLLVDAHEPAVQQSLQWILDFKLAKSLRDRLGGLAKHIQNDGRIHSRFDDRQASGRISSSKPNLQQLAGFVDERQQKEFLSPEFRKTAVRSRNAIIATPGYRLVAFDIAQADVRCLAHIVESFQQTDDEYLCELQGCHGSPTSWHYQQSKWDYFQPWNRSNRESSAPFDPSLPCRLASDFRQTKSDFYTVAATRMLGKPPKDKVERDRMKRTILGIINQMSATTLAERLNTTRETANEYLERFNNSYPQVAAFTEMVQQAFAISGTAITFAGRPRRITSHWWMVTQPYVDLLVSYKRADKLWVRVVPLMSARHVLCCRVLRVVDAKNGSPREGREIYNDHHGRISTAHYRFFEDEDLIFRLPVRNIPWKLMRRVRTPREEVQYEGFDRVRRQLFNHLCQAATSDVVKTMMIRSVPVCRAFGARLLIQIHDELVFEVPRRRCGWFVRRMTELLEKPPTPDFRVPIVVEPKIGIRFGELREVPRRETRMPPRDLARTVRRCLANGQYRQLEQHIAKRLAGRSLGGRRIVPRITKATDARKLVHRILSTYQ